MVIQHNFQAKIYRFWPSFFFFPLAAVVAIVAILTTPLASNSEEEG